MEDDVADWLIGLGARVKAAREAAGLSYRAAAERAGVSLSTVQRAETGADISAATLYRLATVCGMSPADMMPPDKKQVRPRGKKG